MSSNNYSNYTCSLCYRCTCTYLHPSEATASQPVHRGEGVDGVMGVESFTQPSRFDELIIGTQIPCTPGASQVPSLYMYM